MTRREFLGAAGAMGGAAVGLGSAAAQGTPAPAAAAETCRPPLGPVTVQPGDARYPALTSRGYNGRFAGRPDVVHVVSSADQAQQAVETAVREGRRIAVRSGAHCFENFVDDPSVRAVIDISEMNEVFFDRRMQAFAVDAGATLGQIYRTLYLGWGVTLPGGACPTVGAGGHVAGGGYGQLSHVHGLIVDHLYAVEVIVVDAAGKARRVTATCRPADPNRDLWWAHTGGGGGNFGLVTRYWFRTPDTTGSDPSTLLPQPPVTITKTSVNLQWADLTDRAFARLVRNFGAVQEGAGAGSRFAPMNSGLFLYHRAIGILTLDAQVDAGVSDADQLLTDYVAAVTDGLDVPHQAQRSSQPWLTATLGTNMGSGGYRFKPKSSYLRKPWTDPQIAAVYRHITDDGANRYGAFVHLGSFGGRVNTMPPAARAMAHRDSILSVYFETSWVDPAEDEDQLSWVRRLYRDVHADTGGVPVPGERNDGAHINYPDADLADPEWNTSGVPWHTLYYKENYPRLQQAKSRWDPLDIFRHALSVEAPAH